MKKKSKKKVTKNKKSGNKKKSNFANIGQYLVGKNGSTKYIKFSAHKKTPPEAKALIKKLIKALGTDVLFVNVFDADFKEKYNIQDFVKGSVSVDLDAVDSSSDDDSDDEDTDQDDDESEDEDDDSDEDDEDSDDEDDSDDESDEDDEEF